jgi:hypothetical protein
VWVSHAERAHLLGRSRARADPQLGPALAQCVARDDDALALLLLHERRKGAESEAACHIKSLPVQYDQTLFWTEAELAEIEGSNVLGITRQLSIQTRQDYDLLTTAISAAFPELSIQEFGYEDYCWALATIWSRSMDIPVPDTPGSQTPPVAVHCSHRPRGVLHPQGGQLQSSMAMRSARLKRSVNTATAHTGTGCQPLCTRVAWR